MDIDERRIRGLIGRGYRATGEGDVAAVLALMADDAGFFVPGNEPMAGAPPLPSGSAVCSRRTGSLERRRPLGVHAVRVPP